MGIFCLGLNHRTAPVDLRERLAFSERHAVDAARTLIAGPPVSEAVVLSTCNRVEIYGAVAAGCEPMEAIEVTRGFLRRTFAVPDEADGFFYHETGADARRHLLRVVSGLDSMVVGETEIFGQVKKAYLSAHGAGATARVLNRVFQQAFQVGKHVRTTTRITQGATSVGAAAVDLAGKIFGDLSSCRVMILGAGDTSRRTARSLKSRGAGSIIVSNRSYDRAVSLAEEMEGSAVRFDDWPKHIRSIDIMISSTAAPHHVIHRDAVAKAMRQRRGRPLFMIDIAVPRDIDPDVESIEGVYLYDIDALEAIAADGRRQREEQIAACERLIDAELRRITQLDREGGASERDIDRNSAAPSSADSRA